MVYWIPAYAGVTAGGFSEQEKCRKDTGVLVEIPAAYQDIDIVMENQKDLIDVVHTLKQVVGVKG